ncbi:MAG TPA: glucosamine-6-phosphate deaminase [Microbacteriaceae bacterium]|nr:glucosamine-6-phosphate deaminase [Microbacteriaceae bacterium]
MAEVVIVDGPGEGAQLAADLIERLVRERPDAVLGLATGSSPLPLWAALRERALDLGRVHGFALDEYLGLPVGHPESYRAVIDREVVDVLGLDPERVHVPAEGLTGAALAGAGEQFEARIAAVGGVDLQVLGIGSTGHIGFNEPGSSLASRTRLKLLAAATRRDNARFFGGDVDLVPTHCITQGLGTILDARQLVLLAWGEAKAGALAAAVEGPVTASMPASVIQLHPRVTVIADEAAASRLTQAEYYREAWALRPDWAR